MTFRQHFPKKLFPSLSKRDTVFLTTDNPWTDTISPFNLRIGQTSPRCVTYLSLSSFTSLTLSWSPYLLVLLTFLITSFSAKSGVFLEEFVHYESRPKNNGNEDAGFSHSYIFSQHRLYISFFICIALCYPLIYPKDWLLGTSCLFSQGGNQKILIRGGSAPKVQPLTLLYVIFTKKVPLLYTLHWQIVLLSHTLFRTLHPL